MHPIKYMHIKHTNLCTLNILFYVKYLIIWKLLFPWCRWPWRGKGSALGCYSAASSSWGITNKLSFPLSHAHEDWQLLRYYTQPNTATATCKERHMLMQLHSPRCKDTQHLWGTMQHRDIMAPLRNDTASQRSGLESTYPKSQALSLTEWSVPKDTQGLCFPKGKQNHRHIWTHAKTRPGATPSHIRIHEHTWCHWESNGTCPKKPHIKSIFSTTHPTHGDKRHFCRTLMNKHITPLHCCHHIKRIHRAVRTLPESTLELWTAPQVSGQAQMCRPDNLT